MTTRIITLEQVSPFRDGYMTGYRDCDFCQEDACADIWAGKLQEEQWRAFYRLDGGEIVCEHCLPAVLAEDAKH